jgi:hypothetical protein
MTSCGQLKALMKKNLIYAKRNWCSTCCEIVFPMILMILIGFIRRAVAVEEIVLDKSQEEEFFIANSTAVAAPMTDTKWNGLTIRDPL